jgi:hypothetical protein
MSELTREQIVAIQSGKDLDAIIGKIIGVKPKVTHEILNADETASAAKFDSKLEAQEYLERVLRDYPNSWLKEYHVGTWEFWPRFSTDLSDAARLLSRTKHYEMSSLPTGAQANFTGNSKDTAYAAFDELNVWSGNPWLLREECQSLAICRAFLLSIPYQDEDVLNGTYEKEIAAKYDRGNEDE